MRRITVILRADLKRLWRLSIVVTSIVILHGWIDFQLGRGFVAFMNSRWVSVEPLLLLAAWWCLVGALVQQQRLPPHSQQGVNNSISSVTILSGKALFLILFISLPSFLAQSVVLALSGFSLTSYFGPSVPR
jgi:hypothetical protein